jgi:hypothetical protein
VVKAARHLMNLNAGSRRLGCRAGFLLELAAKHPDTLPTETIDGHRYFNPGDIDALKQRALALCRPALEGR